ncbi:MAG: TonB-dependent receptor, partial [Acidobacteriaceae bacterium]|nr:TonB-dependent receptor [Acidobacteriaceae bacterium]
MRSFALAKRYLVLGVLALSLGAVQAVAQFSSGIEGTVKEASGSVVEGAKVTVRNTQLGVEKTATTNDSGYFRIASLGASTYTVQIEMRGFTTWQQNDLVLEVGETRTLSPVLQIGAVTENVTVTAAPIAVQLTNATTGSVVSQTEVEHTPLPGQNVFSLAALSPGITGNAVTSGDNYTNEYAININAAGLRQEENGYQMDGAYTDTPSRGGGASISPNPEIVQSIDIRANDFDAEKGRNGGATVEVFTKSGANQTHGTLDYYFLNNVLSARTEFESSVPPFKRNEMGATIGGRIIKDKLFYYGGIDVLRSSVTSAYQATVETQDLLSWAQTNLPNNIATQIMKTAAPLAYPSTGIRTVSQLAASTPGYYPLPAGIPGNLPAVGTANISYSVPKNGYQYSIRADAYATVNDRFYAEFMRTYDTSVGATARPALNENQANSSDFANLNWTHTFSSTLLNEAGASMIRPYGSNLPVATNAFPYINVVGLNGFSNWGPGNFTQTTFGWRDILSDTVKTHTLKFGLQINNIREYDSQTGADIRPTFNFNNVLDFIQDEATSESATPVNLLTHQQATYYRAYRALYMGFFAQDDWKVTPRFTLNLGIRYDVMPNFFSILSPKLTNFNLGPGSGYYQQIADGSTGLAPNNHVLNHNLSSVTPRIGFAWDVFGTGKTAIRGGFGMFASQPPYLHITDILANNLPNTYTPSLSVYQGTMPVFQLCSPPTGYDESCPIVNTGNVVLNPSGGILGRRANLGGYSPDYKFTQIEAWSLSVEQQLRRNLVLQLNYSGTAAHHLPVFNNDLNRFAGDLIVNNDTLTRLNPNFGTINYGTSNGNSIGNFASASLRMTSGPISLLGNYTYGKALDTFSTADSLDSGSITTTTQVIQNGQLAAQRGRSDFDIRQQFSFN